MNLPKFLQLGKGEDAAPNVFAYASYLQQQLSRPNLSSEDRAIALKELRLRTDTILTLTWILGLSIFALIFTLLASWKLSPVDRTDALSQQQSQSAANGATAGQPLPKTGASSSGDGRGGTDVSRAGHVGVSLLWAVGLFGGGLLIGFLFGIPRSVQLPAEADPKASVDSSRPTPTRASGPTFTVNTNLEQISDWLTKILVGVGLVEAKNIFGHILTLAHFMADTDSGIGSISLALAMLMTFMALGFLMGYLATRMFLSPVLALADSTSAGVTIQAQAVLAAVVGVSESAGDTTSLVSPDAKSQARSVVSSQQISTAANSFDSRYLHAKSLLLTGEFAQAALEYASLVAERPLDAKLRRERLWAMFKSGRKWSSEIAGILSALDEIRWSADQEESTHNFLSLSFHYLYAGTQQAAQHVLDRVNEFKSRTPNAVPAGMYINLACAHAQLYRLDTASGTDVATNPHTKLAAQAVTEALRLEPTSRQRIKNLMDPNAEDNDLVVFSGSANPVQAALS